MKKIISTFLMIGTLAFTGPLMTTETSAATTAAIAELSELAIRPCYGGRVYRTRVSRAQRNRRLWNALIASGIGAALGGGIGGGRGALIGAGSGAGGYLAYTYFKDRRGRCVPRYVRV